MDVGVSPWSGEIVRLRALGFAESIVNDALPAANGDIVGALLHLQVLLDCIK